MNLHPKQRPLWQRALALPALTAMMGYKAAHLPRKILPRAFRSMITNWDYRQYLMLIKSGINRAYIDQPCEFRMPTSFQPKAQVDPQYAMSTDQIRQFYQDGFIGPFDAFSPEEMADFRKDLLAEETTTSETYGFVTPRDRHFENPRLWNYMKSPAITERLAQLLGPDVLVWRTQVFYKPPKSPSIQWHQASTFMVEDYLDPALFPQDRGEIFQLTAWVAVDDTTFDNGCLDFVRGSHESVRTIRFGGEEGFYNAQFSLEFDRDESKFVRLPVKAGQFIIFTERCIHGSGPNTTDRHRLAFNLRAIPANVPVYTHTKKYRSVYNGGKYDLKNWGVTTLRGTDPYRLSRSVDIDALHRQLEQQRNEQRRAA